MFLNKKFHHLSTAFVATGATFLAVIPIAGLAEDKSIEEVLITGTHIARAREEMSMPVDVLDRDEYESQGSPDMLDIIQNMPAVSGSDNRSDQYTGGTGNTGTQNINMRGLGSSRTLNLVNGKRGMGADVGSYPQIAMSRIELLKNGGSTTYGSDAIAGVFNFITRDRFEGAEVRVSHSDIDGSDGDSRFSAIGGVAGDNYNIVASFEIEDRSSLRLNDANLSVDPNPNNGSWYLGKSDVGHPGAFLPYNPETDTAVRIDLAPTIGAAQDPSCGTVYGESASFPGAGGKCAYYYTNFVNVTDPAKRAKFFVQGRYDLNDSKELYGSLLYSTIDTNWFTSPSYLPSAEGINYSGVSPAVVHPNNPGLLDFEANEGYSAAQAAAFANSTTDGVVFIGRIRGAEGPALDVKKEWEKYNLSVGSRGDLTESISYDASISIAHESRDEPDAVEVLNKNFRNALSGLGGDNCSGLAADRGNANAGCLWYNPFGSAIGASASSPLANSDEVMDYMMGDYNTLVELDRLLVDVVLSGDLPSLELAGGSVAWAAGAQFIDFDTTVDPYGDNNAALYPEGYVAFGALPTGYKNKREEKTTSAFAEVQLPVLDNLSVDMGLRYVDYKIDSVTTPKLSARWDITDNIALRASYEEGFRRPVIPTSVAVGITQPAGSTSYVSVETPIPDSLKPEESENLSIGLLASPIEGLNISVDYWEIKLMNPFQKESSTSSDAERVLDPTTGALVKIITELTNGGNVELEGWDFQADYTWDTNFAALQFGVNGTYLDRYDMYDKTSGDLVYEAAGFYNLYGGAPFAVEALPKLRSNAYLSMMKGNHFFRVYARYIEDTKNKSGTVSYFAGLGGVENPSEVDEFLTYDAHYTYTLPSGDTSASVSVLNLTDEKAPGVMHFMGYDARTHSPLGRVAKFSVKHSF
jgi:iron complex outermembrane receptor protein